MTPRRRRARGRPPPKRPEREPKLAGVRGSLPVPPGLPDPRFHPRDEGGLVGIGFRESENPSFREPLVGAVIASRSSCCCRTEQ